MDAQEPPSPAVKLLRGALELSGDQTDVFVDLTAAATRASLSRDQALEAAGVLVGKRYAVLQESKAIRLTAAGAEAAASERSV